MNVKKINTIMLGLFESLGVIGFVCGRQKKQRREEMSHETLSEKEKEFCRAYAKGMAVTEAAKAAGYANGSYGKQLLQKEKIRTFLAEMEKKAAGVPSEQKKEEGKIAPGDEILAFLTETMRGGEETDIKTRMRAAELLGRRNGAFAKEEAENSRVIIIDDIGREEG